MLGGSLEVKPAETIKVVTYGRKSNLPHVVEVRFVASGRGFYVFGAAERSDWVVNSISGGSAKVRLAELSYPCKARRATPEESDSAFGLFRNKYGDSLVRRWYKGARTCLFFEVVDAPVRRGAVSGESDTKIDYAGWKSTEREYYGDVAAAFDSASEEYDFTISHNFINTWIRRRFLEVLGKYLRKSDVALEIGCGTGTETIQVAKQVRRVVACDISEGMVSLLEAKIRARKVANILPLKIGASEVSLAAAHLEGGRTDIAYSLNGALNCEPRLDTFVNGLNDLLVPGGYFVCSVRNTLCLSEIVIHASLLQFGKAMPRLKQPTMVSVGGQDIPATYYPASAFANRFSSSFELREMIALPALLPPAYLSGYYVKLRPVFSPIEALERSLAGRAPFNRLGDQTLYVFQRSA